MMPLQVESPLKTNVWPGAILGSIAHAIFVSRFPMMSHTQSWDWRNYNVQNSEGSRGTIAFAETNEDFVGVLYFEESPRNPFASGATIDANQRLRGLPVALGNVAREALRYLVQEVQGVKKPVTTTAFWSAPSADRILAAESWERHSKWCRSG